MYEVLKNIKFIFEFIRCFPHLLIFTFHRNKPLITSDISRWLHVLDKSYNTPIGLIFLLSFHKPFRNLFYHRIGLLKYLLNIFCPGIETLIIRTKQIGEGLFIWNGMCTTIAAKSIGRNCSVNNFVTIGNNRGYPAILDNVKINAGAIIVGNITIGNNSIIGANATVFSDVPDDCTVYPARCRCMKWKCKKPSSN
jgi:serine O-acetyltransferase